MDKLTYHKPTSQSIALHMHKTTSSSQLDKKCGGHLLWGHIKWDQYIISQYTNLIHSNNNTRRKQITNRKWYLQKQFLILIMQIEIIKQWNVRCDQTKKKSLCIGGKNLYQLP